MIAIQIIPLGPASIEPSDDRTGVTVEIGEGTSASEVNSEHKHRHLSSGTISIILDI